jgi:hypothetical protein
MVWNSEDSPLLLLNELPIDKSLQESTTRNTKLLIIQYFIFFLLLSFLALVTLVHVTFQIILSCVYLVAFKACSAYRMVIGLPSPRPMFIPYMASYLLFLTSISPRTVTLRACPVLCHMMAGNKECYRSACTQ